MDLDVFSETLKQPVLDIPRAALYLARSVAYPRLDVEFYLARLKSLAEQARPSVLSCPTPAEQVEALTSFLFDQLEFRGNHADYYDPRNALLNSVLDRKLGDPASLTILFVNIAQQLGLRAYGIGLPGHAIAGVYADGSEIRLDPFNAGLRLSVTDCERLVRESTGFQGAFQQKWLNPISAVNLLARLLTGLTNAYIQRENWQKAIPVIQHLLLLQPESDFHLRDLGYLYLYNGSLRLSAQYLEEYLRRAPHAPDFENVLSSLEIVAGRLALWN